MIPTASLSEEPPLHEVVTFYSYKGGTGRSMSLANVACLLARRCEDPKGVLVIDWDLEAPGLHYFFRTPGRGAVESTRSGVVELFTRFTELANALETTEADEETVNKLIAEVRYTEFIHPTNVPNVQLMPAGCMDITYEARLRKLDWEQLYKKVPALYRTFARKLADEYAAVLVDSRTGMTDVSNVCSALMPDKLVVVFTPNRQSLAGVEQVVRRSTEYRQLSGDLRPLLVYPLPSRIDGERESLRGLWRAGDPDQEIEGYQPQFERVLRDVYGLGACDLRGYCDEVQIQHSPDYSYGEDIAALDPTKTDRLSIVRGYEALVKWLHASAAPWELPDRALARKRLDRLSAAEAELREKPTPANVRELRSLLEESRAQSILAHGDHHRETLAITERLIDCCLINRTDPGRAVELLDELYKWLPHQPEPQRWRLLDAILRSTSVLHAGKEAGDADRLAQAAIDNAVSGPLKSDDLDVLSAIASDLRRDTMFVEATRLFRSVSETRREVQGEMHPDTLRSMSDLALLLQSQGELAEPRRLLERVLVLRQRALGGDHEETIATARNLSHVQSRTLVQGEIHAQFDPILSALDPIREALASEKDVVTIRPGYGYPVTGKPVPAVVVAVIPGTTPARASQLQERFHVPFTVIDATVDEQLAKHSKVDRSTASTFETLLMGAEVMEFGLPKTGAYKNMEPTLLGLVQEPMDLTICVSPEAGWSALEAFLGEIEKRLTVAMYQFTAPHIFEAVSNAVTPKGRKLQLLLHPIPEKPPESGVKANDLDEKDQVVDPLARKLGSRFEMAWATLLSKAHPDGLWTSAYHMKVAVRDGTAVWLSSSNWQSSDLPDVHLFDDQPDGLPAGFQRKYNRGYHAIIVNDRLASIFEAYIRRDLELSSAQAGIATSLAAPDLFIPEEEEEAVSFAAPPRLFEPLRINRVVSVLPLLTPDNYAENALKLIRSAKKSVWFQNHHINFRGTSDDFIESRLLIGALKDKVDQALDVRIICRDVMTQESLDILVAMGFPREIFRFQPACHNKAIIIDGRAVMFGSHIWSNEAVKTNRDASLIFDDVEIAAYLSQVYEYDWNALTTASPTSSRPRVAAPGEMPPPGMRRASFSEIFED